MLIDIKKTNNEMIDSIIHKTHGKNHSYRDIAMKIIYTFHNENNNKYLLPYRIIIKDTAWDDDLSFYVENCNLNNLETLYMLDNLYEKPKEDFNWKVEYNEVHIPYSIKKYHDNVVKISKNPIYNYVVYVSNNGNIFSISEIKCDNYAMRFRPDGIYFMDNNTEQHYAFTEKNNVLYGRYHYRKPNDETVYSKDIKLKEFTEYLNKLNFVFP